MKAKVKYFGMIAEKINQEEENIEFNNGENVRQFMENKYPELKEMEFKIAINQELREELNENDQEIEIAVLPPFAGG